MKNLKRRVLMKNLPIYFLDVETTGLDAKKDRIIEFCIIKHTKHSTISITYKVNPEGTPVHPEAQKVNGYAEEKWIGQISQAQAAEKIRHFTLDRGVFCGHNVNFDLRFVNRLLASCGYKKLNMRNVDTYTLAYEHLAPMGIKSLSMDEIRRFMRWEVHKNHTASRDAWDVFRLYRRINRMGWLKKTYTWISSIPYRSKLKITWER